MRQADGKVHPAPRCEMPIPRRTVIIVRLMVQTYNADLPALKLANPGFKPVAKAPTIRTSSGGGRESRRARIASKPGAPREHNKHAKQQAWEEMSRGRDEYRRTFAPVGQRAPS